MRPWLVLCLATCGLNTAAETPPQAQASGKLDQVEERIRGLQAEMEDARGQYGLLQQELATQERSIGQLASQAETSAADLQARRKALDELQRRQQAQQARLGGQRQHLARQIRAAYAMGREDYLKLLLNQEDAAKIGRVLTYYDYFNRARARHIESINASLAELSQVEESIRAENAALSSLLDSQRQQKQQLETAQRDRRRILKQLAKTLENQGDTLEKLEDDRQRVEVLMANLRQNAEAQAAASEFTKLKGRLPLPVAGEILHRFGTARDSGNLKWQGIAIAAQAGAKVRCIAAGQVVFADWFRNYGQLIILDHGGDYLSLYAHNQSLYKKPGDSVTTGEIIASVGDSGGQERPALYFEMRHQGTPIDPKPWLAQ